MFCFPSDGRIQVGKTLGRAQVDDHGDARAPRGGVGTGHGGETVLTTLCLIRNS